MKAVWRMTMIKHFNSPCTKLLAVLMGIIFASSSASADSKAVVMVYPAPAGMELNNTFTVEVRVPGGEWHKLDVYDVRVDLHTLSHASFASFDFNDKVEVRVTANKASIRSWEVRPKSYGIIAMVDGTVTNSIAFQLARPRNLSIEINGDRLHNLHLFANQLESNRPSASDTNVIYFGPGLHTDRQVIRVPSNKTVYLAGGAVVQGIIVTDDGATNVTIRGRGILDMTPWNEPKGYFIKGHTWQAAAINLRWTTNALIEGIILKQHTDYAVMGGGASDVTIENLKCFSSHEWADGIDMMSSSHVKIRNCFLRTSDDCIAIYGSRRDYHGNSSDWDVADSVLWADKAHAIMVGVHGAYWADGDVIENLRFHNLDVLENNEVTSNFWGAMAVTCGDKNTVRNLDFENIRVEHIREAGGNLVRLTFGFFDQSTTLGQRIENIHFKDITYDGLAGSFISGSPRHTISGVTFENLVINGEHIKDAKQGKIALGENDSDVKFK